MDRLGKTITSGQPAIGFGIIVSKVIKEKKALSQQLMLYRDFVRAVFLGT